MNPLRHVEGRVAVLDRADVDTDQIIPKQFLKRIERTGFGPFLFYDWRFQADGKTQRPEFELNQPRYRGASILLTRSNFGCGSSREHAPWALTQFGFRAVISTSFADIFKQNSLKNSLLPIVLPADAHAELLALLEKDPQAAVKIDLVAQTLTLPNGRTVEFPVDGFAKHCLVEGVDELGYILKNEAAIAAFEARRVGSINTLA